jgi:hypothetical protein
VQLGGERRLWPACRWAALDLAVRRDERVDAALAQ